MFSKIRGWLGGENARDPRALFAEEVTRFIAALPNITSVEPGPSPFTLEVTFGAGEKHRVYLENAFIETREIPPDRRPAIFRAFFGEIGVVADNRWEASRDLLVPVIRPSGWGLAFAEKKEHAMVEREVLPFLSMFAVVDRPTSMAYVNAKALADWGVSEAAFFEILTARFSVLRDPHIELYDATHGPLYRVATNDTYETSRLLLPGFLASFRGGVDGNPIAIMPERATLMIGGDARQEMIARLSEHAQREFHASNRALSPALYTVDERGLVVPFNIPRHVNAELARDVAIGHVLLAANEYGSQKTALDEIFAKEGKDIYVAGYRAFEADGLVVSRTTWTRGVATLLPRADRVTLVVLTEDSPEANPPKAVVDVPFEAIANRLKKSGDFVVARYETGEFPSDAELRELAAKYASLQLQKSD